MTTTLIRSEKPRAAGGHTGLDNEVAGTNARRPNHNEYSPESQPDEETLLGVFGWESSIRELLVTVDTAEKLGYAPELRATASIGIEVYVRDVPALIGKLQKSLAATETRRRREPTETARNNDPRWKDVTDKTAVIWEGKSVTWGSLSGNEQAMCEFREDGQLIGAHPF